MKFHFWKMHGASNDMILVDDRDEHFPAADQAFITRLAHRRTGIGCEGLILIRRAAAPADFAMVFFNPDGREAEMCGNGARCVARLAAEQGWAPRSMRFDTRAGQLAADLLPDGRVRLAMTAPHDWRLGRALAVDGQRLAYSFVNSGVPHTMIETPDLDAVPVAKLGPPIRHHADFAPRGTNVNFVQVTGPQALRLRTYERGVEAETLACGTGITACALLAGKLGRVRSPVSVTCGSGDVLEVGYELTADGARAVTLTGPAEHCFAGDFTYSG